jgi:ketosteroid isomerase-like protein
MGCRRIIAEDATHHGGWINITALVDAWTSKTSFSKRMKTLNALLLALALVSNLSFLGAETKAANLDESVLQAIKNREDRYTDALLHRNFEELASLFADTYVNTSPSGQLRNKAEFLEAFKADTSRISEIKESEKQTQLYGDTAVVTVKFEVRGTDEGESFEFKGRATDIWIKENGEWLCVAVHSSPAK